MDENTVAATAIIADQKDGMTTIEATATEPAKTDPHKEPKPDSEVEKLKAALSRANGEAAEWKRQLRQKQTEAERAEAERAEQEQAMRDELETLRKEKRVSDYTARCVALNMDADLAGKTANALADGNADALFDCLKAFVDATVTRLNNEALNRQPGLSAGTPPTKGNADDELTAKMRRYAGLSVHR